VLTVFLGDVGPVESRAFALELGDRLDVSLDLMRSEHSGRLRSDDFARFAETALVLSDRDGLWATLQARSED
jgi:hypothetical protein